MDALATFLAVEPTVFKLLLTTGSVFLAVFVIDFTTLERLLRDFPIIK
jgi:hypothetical protein